MKTAWNKGLAWSAKVLFPRITLALAASLAIASCAQDVKITAPRYALLYGIATYKKNPLTYTVADAQGMKTTLIGHGWNSNTIQERENASVTKAQIKADILSLSGISSDSTVLVYYSGHGALVDSTWGPPYYPAYSGPYIVPYDAVGINGLDATTIAFLISPAELESWLAQTGTKNFIVIFDSCYSGGFIQPNGTIDASPPDYSSMPSYSAFSTAMSNFGNLLVANASASGGKTPMVLSAAGSAESSYDGTSAMAHGVFTYFLLQAATNGDSDGDGFVTMTEAHAYTAKGVQAWGAALTQADYNAGIHPFLPHLSGGTRDLVLFTK